MTVFEAYITNLGKYAEGQLVGETLKFPATTEEVQSLLKNIGVDGVRYEEFFITAFDGDVMGLYDYLTEYENLDELNHLAHLISELDSDEIETLEAALNEGDHTSSVADIINLVHNLDCYSLHPGVTDDETLGRIYVEDMELLCRIMCCPTSTLKPTGGMHGSMTAATSPPAVMCSITAAALWSGITEWRTFPRSTASSPIPS